MLVAAAVCPCPPLLVPEVAAGAAGELDDARNACARALAALGAASPDRLVVVGPDPASVSEGAANAPSLLRYEPGSTGSLADFGVTYPQASLRLGEGPGAAGSLPAALTVGAWLLNEASWGAAPVTGYGVHPQLPATACLEAGRRVVAGEERVALLTLGDGSACRSLKAPGYLDERAKGFDAAVATAFASADVPALREMDAGLADELQVGGRSSWQVLAGAAQESVALHGSLLYDDAPYGVGYLVASWS